jgi:predicted lipoprotein with Yx(FWY)xxD motif
LRLIILLLGITLPAACSSTHHTAAPVVAPQSKVVLRVRGTTPQLDVLIDGGGHTLYASNKETGGRVSCTGQCLQVWPEVLVTPSAAVTAEPPVKQAWMTRVHTSRGDALAYHGQLLHTYVGDRSPGETAGQGIGGEWATITAEGSATR